MILDAASACELLKDIVVEKLWSKKNKGRYKRGRLLPDYDITEHLDIPIKSLYGRLYKEEDSVNQEFIANVWDARCNIGKMDSIYLKTHRHSCRL
jgi:hypothetical protein